MDPVVAILIFQFFLRSTRTPVQTLAKQKSGVVCAMQQQDHHDAGIDQLQQQPAQGGTSRHVAVEIDHIRTDIIITEYANRIFILITQRSKMGSLVSASKDGGQGSSATYTVEVLMGSRQDPIPEIYARQIIAVVSQVTEKPLLLSLALKHKEPPVSMLKSLVTILKLNLL